MTKDRLSINDKNLKKHFEENGYVIVKDYFSSSFCKTFLKKINKYANDGFAPIMNPDRKEFLVSQITNKIDRLNGLGAKADLINSLDEDCNYFRKVMTQPKILNCLKKLKNNRRISALMSQMIFKKAKTKYSLQSWEPHQDNSYPLNKNGDYITINIFMNKSDEENGTMYVWDKSHKHGIFNFKRKISYREKDGKPGNISKSKIKFPIKTLKFKKGDMLVLHGNLVHGSFPNKSKVNSRPLYSASYIPTKEKFVAGKNAQRKLLN